MLELLVKGESVATLTKEFLNLTSSQSSEYVFTDISKSILAQQLKKNYWLKYYEFELQNLWQY